MHLREVPRRLGLPLRAARYHLDALERGGLVVSHRAGRFVRYFEPGAFSREEREVISAARVAGSRAILAALLDEGPLPFQALARASGLSNGALFWQLRALTTAQVIAPREGGRYALLDPAAVRMALALQRERLAESIADAANEIFGPRP